MKLLRFLFVIILKRLHRRDACILLSGRVGMPILKVIQHFLFRDTAFQPSVTF